MKTIGYIRVSKEEKSSPGISLNAQTQKIKDYCRAKDLNLIDVICDAGLSAKDLKRPGCQKVLEMVKKNEVNNIVVWRLDRMFRSIKDAVNTMDDVFKTSGIGFHSVTETIDTSSPMGEFIFGLFAGLAQLERQVTSERMKAIYQYKKSRGEHWGKIPMDKDIVNKKQVPNGLKKRIQRMRNRGESLRVIGRKLGISKSTVDNILKRR